MTVASTSAVISQTSTANFDTWINEVYTNLVTNCGVSQLPALMDTGQMAVPSTTTVPAGASTSAGYYMLAFNDTLSAGPLAATALGSGGTGYDGGSTHTYTAVPLTGGSGSGAQATIVVTSGVCANATITTAGTGYKIGDNLSASNANLGGSGSGLSLYVSALTSAGFPCVIKLEFGSGSAGADPQMWVTIGTSWTSSGTVGAANNGVVTTRVAALWGGTQVSTSTAYTSRYCYNATEGFLGLVFKIGGVTAVGTTTAMGAIFIFRTSSNSGAPNSNAMVLIASGSSASSPGNALTNGVMQCMSYANNIVYPTLNAIASTLWVPIPWTESNNVGGAFNLSSTLENGTVFIFPILTIDPVLRFSAVLGLALANDIPIGSTASVAIIGATPSTFINVGFPFGGVGGYAGTSWAGNNIMIMMLWQ